MTIYVHVIKIVFVALLGYSITGVGYVYELKFALQATEPYATARGRRLWVSRPLRMVGYSKLGSG